MTEVYIIGPSSTGKTTLCRALAATLGLEESTVISEVARDVMRGGGYTREDVGMLEMQAAIMGAQLLRERQARAAASQSRRILLSDRSAIDPIAYAVLSSASKEEAEGRVQYLSNSSQFQSALLAYRQSVVVLLAPVPEWLMDDGVRNIENQVSAAGKVMLLANIDGS